MSIVCRKVLVLALTISRCSSEGPDLDSGEVDAAAKLSPMEREGDEFPPVSTGKILIPTFAFQKINLEAISCQTDEQCYIHLPNLDIALAKNSNFPSAPYCNKSANTSSLGHCGCGEGKCVSYTKEFGRGTILYYCGPCSYVGARCSDDSTCQHELAECRDNFCACKNGGDFFEFSYCEVPHLGLEVAVNMAFVVCIAISICLVLASSYGIISMHRLRRLPGLIRYLQSHQRQCEPATEDLPPKYDDLVDKLPSYEEAIFTIQKNPSVAAGRKNLAFDPQEETEALPDVDLEAASRGNPVDQRGNYSVPVQPYQSQTYVKYPQSDAGGLAKPPSHHTESDVKFSQSDAGGLANPPPGFGVDNELINPSARSHSTRRPDETPIRELLVKHTHS
ncbi:uncharacterized protein LOC125035267 isoform X1 [Penaeus chinensis]|uniref:uncharacterized protein LOC125035267 isoform X1 n=1 Tax=Penaeus chinensis TaxID=139456 RepID=UPI001FB67266|nr:uncharacterized protein LOC125035267 isoform X1 [Penaeus chinensis]